MAERRLHGLQRVPGTYALASSVYGNVGSSIYYALGLVASFALGLTPLVFILSGVIFYLAAATSNSQMPDRRRRLHLHSDGASGNGASGAPMRPAMAGLSGGS
jgi:hypothetical protein